MIVVSIWCLAEMIQEWSLNEDDVYLIWWTWTFPASIQRLFSPFLYPEKQYHATTDESLYTIDAPCCQCCWIIRLKWMQADQDNNIFKGLVEQGITVKEFRNKEKRRKNYYYLQQSHLGRTWWYGWRRIWHEWEWHLHYPGWPVQRFGKKIAYLWSIILTAI